MTASLTLWRAQSREPRPATPAHNAAIGVIQQIIARGTGARKQQLAEFGGEAA